MADRPAVSFLLFFTLLPVKQCTAVLTAGTYGLVRVPGSFAIRADLKALPLWQRGLTAAFGGAAVGSANFVGNTVSQYQANNKSAC